MKLSTLYTKAAEAVRRMMQLPGQLGQSGRFAAGIRCWYLVEQKEGLIRLCCRNWNTTPETISTRIKETLKQSLKFQADNPMPRLNCRGL